MKQILIALLAVTLIACGSTKPSEPMRGGKVDGQMKAYTEMCKREPASPLCPAEGIENLSGSDLNAQWCEMCKEDSSYSWCNTKALKHCATGKVKPQEMSKEEIKQRCLMCMNDPTHKWCYTVQFRPCAQKGIEAQSKTGVMTGNKVRIRAEAYEKLCAREPNSVLCTN